jgi:replication factor C subunit 3/5
MSDYEDEMDVDAPVADTNVTFGGDTKKGKRSAANLPVEAEDSLPWYATIAADNQLELIEEG